MKFTVDGNVIEGTPEEIKEMMTLLGAEFPKSDEAEEVAEETPTFKEGDRVRTLADGESGDVSAGEVGTVKWIYVNPDVDDPYTISVYTEDDCDYFRPQDLELVTEEVVKFSVGDIVVITGNTNKSRNDIGDIGKVSKLRTEGKMAKVDVPSKPNSPYVKGNWTKYSEMRHATDEEKAQYEEAVKSTKIAELGRKPGEFKKGDIVRANRNLGNREVIVGEICEDTPDGNGSWALTSFVDGEYRSVREVELIAPVEARVDL